MAVHKYFNVITDTAGNSLSGVAVEVKNLDGSAAVIYASSAGTVPVSNIVTTNEKGMFTFYALFGQYNLSITGVGIEPYTQTDVTVGYFIADIPPERYDFAISASVDGVTPLFLFSEKIKAGTYTLSATYGAALVGSQATIELCKIDTTLIYSMNKTGLLSLQTGSSFTIAADTQVYFYLKGNVESDRYSVKGMQLNGV